MTQVEMIAGGCDKRCRVLVISADADVRWEPDGVYVAPDRFAPLPVGYRIRNKEEGSEWSTLPPWKVAYFVQHDTFAWVKEAQPYPRIRLTKGSP